MESPYPNEPRYTDDIISGVPRSVTVVHALCLPLAIYMGFEKIYFLGVDCDYSGKNGRNITSKAHYSLDNYISDNEREIWLNTSPTLPDNHEDLMRITFESAEKYSRKHNFRIYNAARGGKLEAFERVDFDSLFDNE